MLIRVQSKEIYGCYYNPYNYYRAGIIFSFKDDHDVRNGNSWKIASRNVTYGDHDEYFFDFRDLYIKSDPNLYLNTELRESIPLPIEEIEFFSVILKYLFQSDSNFLTMYQLYYD